MERVKVEWCDEDLKSEMINLGVKPTKENMKSLKETRLIRNIEDAMTMAGWEAMRETITTTFIIREEK